jgi:DNA-binding transcriptional ArsR family regulator
MDKHIRERAGALFGALAHPTRLRIVELLLEGEKTVNDIAATLGVLQSGTSQHLAILTRAGVLVVEQRGSSRYYRVRGPRVARILTLIEEFCTVHGLYGTDDAAEPEEAVSLTGPAGIHKEPLSTR